RSLRIPWVWRSLSRKGARGGRGRCSYLCPAGTSRQHTRSKKMRGSLNTNSKIVLAGALGLGSIVGLAAPALAETPAHQGGGMVLELPAPQPEPGDIIVNPTPEPEAPK